ncbi:MAG TPA: isoprenylcysteine carboxylmethyltransferase family protein [Waterburya sp.]|jgi:protein-S-isoprenylcysteine O-methyltransferase Ste14
MNSFLKAIGLLLALVVFISILIVLPAFLFGAFGQWQIFVLGLGYFCFFLGTIWRTLKYGELTPYREDEQVKRTSGRLASIIQITGLLGVHWLAIYDFSHAHKHESYAIEAALTTVAIFLIVLSIIINQIAVRTLGKFFDRLTIKPEHQLITTGIYSWVQHPIYLSYILLFVGFCTLLQSSISFVLLAIVCIIWFGNRIMIEEELLVQEFGEDYKTYQQQTKRIFPFIY